MSQFDFYVNFLNELSSRGSQRERDRLRAQARAGQKVRQPKDDGLTPEQRRERDAKALQEKTARKAAQANGAAGNNNRSDVHRDNPTTKKK